MPKFDITSNVRPSIFAYVPEQKAPEKDKVERVKAAVLSTTAKASARQREKEKKEKAVADGYDTMELDEPKKSDDDDDAEIKVNGDTDMKLEEDSDTVTIKKKAPPEANSETLPNLSRVVGAQMSYISFPLQSRYLPVRPLSSISGSSTMTAQPTKGSASPALILQSIVDGPSSAALGAGGGILVLKDTKPEEAIELVEEQAMRALQLAATGGEETVPEQTGIQTDGPSAPSAPTIDVTLPIAPIPEPFQYDDFED